MVSVGPHTVLTGHEGVREALSAVDAPQVSLIEGVEGIGKRLVAREAAGARGSSGSSLIEVGSNLCSKSVNGILCDPHAHRCDGMTVMVADHISERVSIRSRGWRTVLFDAGMLTPAAANALLKLLEEPPQRVMFVMWASSSVLPTVASRAVRFRCAPLSVDETTSILVSTGIPQEKAWEAARISGGRPGRAQQVVGLLSAKSVVTSLVRAGVEDDGILLSNVCRSLSPQTAEDQAEIRANGDLLRGTRTVELLRIALSEVRMGQYNVFTATELQSLAKLPRRDLDRAFDKACATASSGMVARSVVSAIQVAVRKAEARR